MTCTCLFQVYYDVSWLYNAWEYTVNLSPVNMEQAVSNNSQVLDTLIGCLLMQNVV